MSQLLTTGPHVIDTHEEDDDRVPCDPWDVPRGYERLQGQLVEKPEMGYQSSWVASELYFWIRTYLAQHPIGVVTTAEASFAGFPGQPDTVRKPDVAVVLIDPSTFVPPQTNCSLVPALIVDVVSPSDRFSSLNAKVALFLQSGTRLAWIVDPIERRVTIERANGSIERIMEPASLDGEDVLPGFAVPLAAFLPILPAATPAGETH